VEEQQAGRGGGIKNSWYGRLVGGKGALGKFSRRGLPLEEWTRCEEKRQWRGINEKGKNNLRGGSIKNRAVQNFRTGRKGVPNN